MKENKSACCGSGYDGITQFFKGAVFAHYIGVCALLIFLRYTQFLFKGQVIMVSSRVPYFVKNFGHWCPVMLIHMVNFFPHTESPLSKVRN